jgi:hypothetical protein
MTITLEESFRIMDAIAFTIINTEDCDDVIQRTQAMFVEFCKDENIDKIVAE